MKKILRLCVAIILCVVGLAVSVGAADVLYKGTCGAFGDNLTWTLDSEGTLTIGGSGAMKDYSFLSAGAAPWYNYRSSIKTLSVGEGVTSIGDSAFEECSSLKSVTIPKGVTSIGVYAFYDCSSLTAITVDKNNLYYSNDERGVLFNKDKTTLIQYPIGNTAASYAIPSGVTSIGDSAFSGCKILTSVTIPKGVTSIGSFAFYDCSSLTSVTIPESVTSIGSSAFLHCSSLTSVTIPSGVTSIGVYAFYGCSRLTSVTIPESVTSIGHEAFYGCRSLTSVTILEGVTSIGDSAFWGCSSLKSVTIPSSVTSIGGFAFRDCSSLTSVTIPEGVTSIVDYAFSNCSSLTSVTIPESVTSIDYRAFYGCNSLKTVYFEGSREQFDKIYIGVDNEPLTKAELIFGSPAVPHSHPVLSTDIRSYIYGSEIKSYNVNGSTCVVAEDLMNYGFTVVWDGNARSLSVTHPSEDFTQEIKRDFGAKTGSIGEKISETVPTDIVTYINGESVPSFNIGGRTVIYIDSLAVFGSVVWDGGARTISLG